MPIKKLCPRCRKIIDVKEKHCSDCSAFYMSKNKEYDKRFRNKKNHSFYTSGLWLATREKVLSDYDNLDVYQLMVNNRIVGADTVHHIIELNDNFELRLDLNNLIPISSTTHMLVHSMYRVDKAGTQELLRRCMVEYKKKYK